MRRLPRQRLSTAYHEAGHAVIGRVMGQVCGRSSILPDADSSGHSMIADPLETASAWDAIGRWRDPDVLTKGRIITYMAGDIAALEALGVSLGGDADDRKQVWRMLQDLLPASYGLEQVLKYRDRLQLWASHHVRRHKKTISDVAEAPLKKGILLPDEIDDLVKAPVRLRSLSDD